MIKSKSKIGIFQWTLNQWFESAIYLFIFLSMVLLVVDNPMIKENSAQRNFLNLAEKVITYTFMIEAMCRIIGLGFYKCSLYGRKAYISNGSNQIDFLVVGCDVLILYNEQFVNAEMNNKMMKSFKVLRAFRALRPLRVISRNPGLKLALGSLFGAVPAIFNGMIFCILVVFIYAIIGMSFLKGELYYCAFKNNSKPDVL